MICRRHLTGTVHHAFAIVLDDSSWWPRELSRGEDEVRYSRLLIVIALMPLERASSELILREGSRAEGVEISWILETLQKHLL